MLSKEAEHFLLQLRMELLSRGKKDEDIEAIEDELRDHLYEAEARGESVESVTGGSVKEYAKSISEELPFDKSVIKIIIGALSALILFIVLPQLLTGKLDVSTPRLIFYALMIFVEGPLLIYLFIQIVKKYGDQKKTYIIAGIIGASSFLFILGGEFILQHFIKATPVELDYNTSFYIGIAAAVIGLACSIYFKQWIYIYVIIAVSIPDIAARIVTDGAVESKEYAMIAAVLSTIFYAVFFIGSIIYFIKDSKRTENQ